MNNLCDIVQRQDDSTVFLSEPKLNLLLSITVFLRNPQINYFQSLFEVGL